jgi:hypothetical protein
MENPERTEELGMPYRQVLFGLLLTTTFVSAQNPTPVPATTLCDTGLTPKSGTGTGCTTSTLVTPINPFDGGPIVDGNWDLAQPYPSASYTAAAPNPCSLATAYAAAPVNAPAGAYYNPDDHLSQWISPLGGNLTPPGWYIYRTAFQVAPASTGYLHYALITAGQYMADNETVAIYLEDPAGDSASCGPVASFNTGTGAFAAWNPFKITVPVIPATHAYMYFVVYNAYTVPLDEDPTALRVEFTSPAFYPY